MKKLKPIEWKAMEHHHGERSHDWFWGVVIIAAGIAILAIYFDNILFSLVILLGAFSLIMHAHTPPQIQEFKIGRRGVQAGPTVFPYSNLESFWVVDEEIHDQIILKTNKFLMPLLILPFDSTKTDPEAIRDYLLQYIDEEELEEPALQIIAERLGF